MASVLLARTPCAQESEYPIDLPESVVRKLTSDPSQLHAAQVALNQSVSIIQGPPGTGKTYVGIQIVQTILKENPGAKILCLCYTNHALDSFLESLLDDGVQSSHIIRLGSASKVSDKVKPCCYQGIQSSAFSRSQSALHYSLKARLVELRQSIGDIFERILSNDTFTRKHWYKVEEFLYNSSRREDQKAHDQLFAETASIDGMTVAGRRGKAVEADYLWKEWLDGRPCPAAFVHTIRGATQNIWLLALNQRVQLAKDWYDQYLEGEIAHLFDEMSDFERVQRERADLREDSKLPKVQNARIFACTTTFAAKNHSLIESFQPSVMVIEEAAEILEAHVITNLTQSTRQIIMIGDHLQLRPKLECYSLRKEAEQGVDFDVSLFERLVRSNFPYCTLEVQHRMRPDISKLIKHTYPTLRDAPSVLKRSNIRGCFKNIAFIRHNQPENGQSTDAIADTASKVNNFEVNMVLRMLKYFLQQGYSGADMVVLTPYLGQLMCIRRAIRAEGGLFKVEIGERDKEDLAAQSEDEESLGDDVTNSPSSQAIRVATIDNFQGEEAKIIITSLVRSNASGDIGFVSGAERVNVLMSRARDGLYVIGNEDTFRNARSGAGRDVWKKVLDELQAQGAIVTGFPSACACHGTRRLLQSPDEFDTKAPDGGCDMVCQEVLPSCPVGHRCTRKCHPNNDTAGHSMLKCMHDVPVSCANGHMSSKVCSNTKPFRCQELIFRPCPAGHQCPIECHTSVGLLPPCKKCAKLARDLEAERLRTAKLVDELQKQTAELEIQGAVANAEVARESVELEERRKQAVIKADIDAANKRRKEMAKKNKDLQKNPVVQPDFGGDVLLPYVPPMAKTADQTGSALPHPASSSNHEGATTVPNMAVSLPTASGSQGSKQRGGKPGKKAQTIVEKIIKAIADNNPIGGINLIRTVDQSLHLDSLSDNFDPQQSRLDLVWLYLLCCDQLGESALKLTNSVQNINCTSVKPNGYPNCELGLPFLRALGHYTSACICSKNPSACNLAADHCSVYLASCSKLTGSPWTTIWREKMQDLESSPVPGTMPAVDSRPEATPQSSATKTSWSSVKGNGVTPSEAMDTLLEMTGLESVKADVLSLFHKVKLSKEQQKDLTNSNFNTRFDGNPGTGKTTVANIYTKFLIEVGVLPEGCSVLKRTGSELSNNGVTQLEKDLTVLKEDGGGVVFVDEAYQLNDTQGHRILDFILAHAERMKGEFGCLVWIFAGYKNQMDDLFKHNVGLPSRFPSKFNFADYEDDELLSILKGIMTRGGDDISPPRLVSKKPKEEKKAPKKATTLNMSSQYARYSQNKPDETDRWGNVWHWSTANSTFEDEYGNITGYGSRELGSLSNPLVSTIDGNIMWLFNANTSLWYDRDDPFRTSEVYPGKPVPQKRIVRERKTPFRVTDEKWLRIAVRRLGRLRGTTGFGNARAVRNLFDASHSRQVNRITKLRTIGISPDIFLFERDDLLGPKATEQALISSSAWQDLLKMEGLASVKKSLKQLLDLVVNNAGREEREQKLLNTALNRVFLGNPGTGKTTVAQLYGRILADLGLLSKGEVLLKTASDFVGNAMGCSEEMTRGILEQAKGCVLVIDEAYGLYSAASGGKNEPYREAVINTLVEQIQGVPGEDRAVILLGYKEEMEEMLSKTNPGMSRRFQLENAFVFEDYDDTALVKILKFAASKDGLQVSTETAIFAVKRLTKARAGPHFGNAGAVNNLLSSAKLRMQDRLTVNRNRQQKQDDVLLSEDFVPPGYTEEVMTADSLLQGLVGCHSIRSKLEDYRDVVEGYRAMGKDPKDVLSFNYIFTGAPGTGKTTIARLLGKMFLSLGLIPTDDFIETSASDLVPGYVGQTGGKTREIFSKARGKVLFIDEAYQLNPKHGGSFMQEAVDEIVKCLTHQDYKGKMIVILAGYEKEIDEMLDVNQGLRSRFTERIPFDDFSVETIQDMLLNRLQLANSAIDHLADIAGKVKGLRAFANGRDVDAFVKKTEMQVVKRLRVNPDQEVTLDDMNKALQEMVQIKGTAPSAAAISSTIPPPAPAPKFATKSASMAPPPPPVAAAKYVTVTKEETASIEEEEGVAKTEPADEKRFLGVLQSELDDRGLNSLDGVAMLSSYAPDDMEFMQLARDLAFKLDVSEKQVMDMLIKWQGDQAEVRKLLEEQKEKERMAKAQKRKAMVPIWRCGVCGRADMPYIACYVAPFIVRYDEREPF